MYMRERERERNGAPKCNVLTSGSPMANHKSSPDYSVFITIYTYNIFFPNFTYPKILSFTALNIVSENLVRLAYISC
jgi:hypothetical protein